MLVRRALGLLGFLGTVLAGCAAPFGDSPFGPVVATTLAAADHREPDRGNRVALLDNGYDALLLRVHLIRAARKSIEIQTFIWTNDEVGRLMMYELIEAAKRGVQVRIIADQMVSDQDPATVAFLATVHPNLAIKHYRPPLARLKPSRLQLVLAGLFSFHGVNQRMHNKVMILDEAVLITGGRNVENTYFDHSTGLNFRDRDVLVVGPAVRAASESFEEFWQYRHAVPSRDLVDVAAAIASGRYPHYARREDYDFGGYFAALDHEADDRELVAARFVTPLRPVERATFICDVPGKSSGFLSRNARITRRLRETLEQARERVTMQTPYLVLSGAARRLIVKLKERNPGLVIRVSTNSFASTDNLAAYSANYRLRGVYIEDLQLEVHEFKPRPAALPVLFPHFDTMAEHARRRAAAPAKADAPFLSLHAKSLVVDDRVAFVGSYNLDPRSENLNTEVGLLVEDAGFARELRGKIDRDMRAENSWTIARRQLPLRLEVVNSLVSGVLALSPVDLWPIQNTSSFELKPGGEEVPPGDARFHQLYREVGAFPGATEPLSNKEILTRLFKVVGAPITPVL